ncbi:MAG: aminotransferase class IV, partial [Pseudomonadota bacterium]
MAQKPLPYAWHETQLMPLEDVRISPFDRGYLFGDGVYEVIPFYDAQPVGLDEHLDRLCLSLDAIALEMPHSRDTLISIFNDVVAANGGGHQSLYLQYSRSGDIGRDHVYPDQAYASLFVMCHALTPPTSDTYLLGKSAVLAQDTRWLRCDIKSTSLLANVMSKEAAAKAGAIEAILHRDGFITEGSTSAIGIVSNGTLKAPPLDTTLLPSVTRTLTFEVAEALGIPAIEGPVSVDECLS